MEFILESTEMFNTPGVINWAIQGMTKGDARKWLKLSFPKLTELALENLVSGTYKVDHRYPHDGAIIVEG